MKSEILLVHDQAADAEVLTALLTEQGYRIQLASGRQDALDAAHGSRPNLILLHMGVFGTDGYAICRELKACRTTGDIPVIFVEPPDRAEAFAAGGADYVATPMLKEELLARIETHLALQTMQGQLQERKAQLEREIAERVRLEEALHNGEQKGRDLIENLSDVIYTADRDGVLTYVSPAIERMIGYPPSEVIGHRFERFIHSEDLPRMRKNFRSVLSGRAVAHEYRMLTKAGKIRWMRTSSQPTFEDDLVLGVQGVLSDITRKKQAEEELRASQQLLHSTLDSLSASIAILDDAGTILAVNRSWCRFADDNGLEWEDYGVGRDYLAVVDHAQGNLSEEAIEAAAGIRQLMTGERDQFTLEYPCHSPTQHRWFLMHATRFHSSEGVRIVAAHEDITESKQSEHQITEQNAFLTSILESLTHPFYVVDANDYTIRVANSAARAANLSGHITCYALAHGRSSPCGTANHPCPLEEIKRTKRPVTVEHIHYDQDGRPRNVEVYGYPLFDGDGKVTQVIEYTLDITERRQAEEALRESETRWRSLAENSPDHVIILDTDLNIQFVNYASPGLTVEDLIGTPLYIYAPEGKRSEVREILERVLKTAKPSSYETEYSTPGGDTIFYQSRVVARTFDDQIIGLAVNARDITDYKEAEQALRRAKEAAEEARREEQQRRQEAEQRRRVAESLAGVIAALNSKQSLDQALDYIATQAGQMLGSRAVAIHHERESGKAPAAHAAQGLPDSDVGGVHIPAGRRALERAMNLLQPVFISDLSSIDPELLPDLRTPSADVSQAAPRGAVLAVPIVAMGQVHGGMVLYFDESRVLSNDELGLATTFSDQIALAIENARLRDQVEEAAASAERSRLARDLHDSVTQALFSASLVAEVLPNVWQRDPDEAQQGLEELRLLTRGALAEMRTLLLELRPTALVETKLDDLMSQLTEAITSRAQVLGTVNTEPIPALPPDVHLTFYRVAQEALNNVVKHAFASQVIVSLHASPPFARQQMADWKGQVILQVSDDGQGFDASHREPGQLGLGMMRERAGTVGAMLNIASQPGQGTQVTLIWQHRARKPS